MARVLSRRSAAASVALGLLVWNCSSNPEPGASDEHAGSTGAGASGALGGTAGSSTDAGGTTNSGGDAQQAMAGLGGNAASGGSAGGSAGGASETGGSASGGMATGAQGGADFAGASGRAEGGAAGSADSTPDFEGHCGQGWAASGAARPELSGNVTPQSGSASSWSFTFGRYRLVVDAAHGARVIEFSIDGNNLIDATGGSTFWPSPQQNYTWPPPAEIDSAAYKVQADTTSLGLTSAVATFAGSGSSTFKLSVHKRFSVNSNSAVVSIEYQLTNESATQSVSWAPWEVTRVRAGGYTFAPRGPGNRTITEDSFQNPLPMSSLPPPPATDAIEWLDYPGVSAKLTKDNYITEFDGAEGFLAHANRFGKSNLPVLFVKSFVDAPDESLPPNQAEIQLWTSGTANPKLIEVEEQGALVELAPGASLTWTVHWSACELPSASVLAAGNADLAALARAHAVKP